MSVKIVIAIDSFKGSVTSVEAGNAICAGVLHAVPNAEVTVLPLADGGEGTVEALTAGMNGQIQRVTVTGPLGTPVEAIYGTIPEKGLAVIDMSQAAGLSLVPAAMRNPMNTTTFGVGEIIRHALDAGCRDFIIGIGGSATNDCGIGMLSALGCVFRSENGDVLEGYGRDLERIASFDLSGLDGRIAACTLRIACDVNNPLCGENGCSAVYGPQKGATPEIVASMDGAIRRFSELVLQKTRRDQAALPGAGAAGGLGYAFSVFLNGALEPGISIILDTIGLAEAVQGADFVITGEGKLDFQTTMGKAPIGVAEIAKQGGAVVIAFCGTAFDDANACNAHGIDAFFPILRAPMSLEHAMMPKTTLDNLQATAEQVFLLIKALR